MRDTSSFHSAVVWCLQLLFIPPLTRKCAFVVVLHLIGECNLIAIPSLISEHVFAVIRGFSIIIPSLGIVTPVSNVVIPVLSIVIPGMTRDPVKRIYSNYLFVFFIPRPRIECGVTLG